MCYGCGREGHRRAQCPEGRARAAAREPGLEVLEEATAAAPGVPREGREKVKEPELLEAFEEAQDDVIVGPGGGPVL